MNYLAVIQSQFFSALAMLEQAVERCPAELWDETTDRAKFWHVAYHALFYTHLYLQPNEREFTPWVDHRETYEMMGPAPWPPHEGPKIDEPYTKADIVRYIDFCRQEVEKQVAVLDLSADSGFSWLPFTKFELQIYSIRHLQQHTGELMEQLGSRANIDVDWVGEQHGSD